MRKIWSFILNLYKRTLLTIFCHFLFVIDDAVTSSLNIITGTFIHRKWFLRFPATQSDSSSKSQSDDGISKSQLLSAEKIGTGIQGHY